MSKTRILSDQGRFDPLWRNRTDEQFLLDCRWEAFRGSGPGGQHRNKTSTAVRLLHIPTGETATASSARSQQRNREAAIEQLRHQIVLTNRGDIAIEDFHRPEWFADLMGHGKRLKLSAKDDKYFEVMGLLLDVLSGCQWSISEAGQMLGISTGNVAQFLRDDSRLWGYVNKRRLATGLRALVGE